MRLDTKELFRPLEELERTLGVEWREAPPLCLLWDGELHTTIEPGEEIDKHIEFVDRAIIYRGNRSVLYIPEKDKRFHFMECTTIKNMRAHERFWRYTRFGVTSDTTGYFKVDNSNSPVRLYVCQNCLQEYPHYKGFDYNDFTKQYPENINMKIRNSFDIAEYFKALGLPEPYPMNWGDISREYRKAHFWQCEGCGVNLADHQDLLHVHHKDGRKYNCAADNLIALCKLCHNEQHPNARLNVTEQEQRIIEECRRADSEKVRRAIAACRAAPPNGGS